MSLFDDTVLVQDADLAAWESKMPVLAQKMNAYAGKRQLAKTYLAKQLIKRGVDPTALSDPTQLKDAAVFKELELMFRDISQSPDDVSAKKAAHYVGLFDDEFELVLLKTTTDEQTVAPTISSIPLMRA